jgi:hypothetical protein
MRQLWVMKLALVSCLVTACDQRTPEEKGKDYANEKLGFVEGAAQVLKEKGNSLGQTAGKGLTELVKGVGSGVKDVVNPPVNAQLSPEVAALGLTIEHASEASGDGDARLIEANIKFAKPFRGKLTARAFDDQGKELGAGTLYGELDKHPGSDELIRFRFPSSLRLSHVKSYRIDFVPPVQLALHTSAQDIDASQLSRKGQSVSLYLKFTQPFKGTLELRAYDDQGADIGRSKPSLKLQQSNDSAMFLEFAFDERAPLDRAQKYELRKR